MSVKVVKDPTVVDMMLGTILVIQDYKEKVEKLKKEIKTFSNHFSELEDAQNITAYSMYNNLVLASDGLDIVLLHLGFSEERAANLYNKLKEKEEQ